MNTFLVRRLIYKDWYLNRPLIVAALMVGAATLVAMAAAKGGQLAVILGVIVLATVLIGMGAVLMSSMVSERKAQTLPFVMTLPVSYLEYTTSKLVGCLLIFLALWAALLLGMILAILTTPWFPHGLIPFVILMCVEILVTTTVLAAVSVTTESQGWTIGAAQLGGIGLNAVGFSIVRLHGIGTSMSGARIAWSPTATVILLAEFAAIAMMLGVAFLIQSRKRDFI
jgi:ABC-2 type transport system permease protein